jgi:hypothetical protein
MPEPPRPVQAVVDLRPVHFQSSVDSFRNLLENEHPSSPFLLIAVRTPREEIVELQVQHEDAYVMAFKGEDGWYCFDEPDKPGWVWGRSCGSGLNYNHLGHVGSVVYDDLNRLAELSRFHKGVPLDKRLCAILIGITSEAARFAIASTYFTGLTNSVGTEHSPYLQGGVDFEFLKNTYFKKWANPPDSIRNGILLPRR